MNVGGGLEERAKTALAFPSSYREDEGDEGDVACSHTDVDTINHHKF